MAHLTFVFHLPGKPTFRRPENENKNTFFGCINLQGHFVITEKIDITCSEYVHTIVFKYDFCKLSHITRKRVYANKDADQPVHPSSPFIVRCLDSIIPTGMDLYRGLVARAPRFRAGTLSFERKSLLSQC